MLGNHSLSGLMKWLAHEEWREPFADVLDLHLGPACEDYEMDFEDIAEAIGDHAAMTLWGCAFEDFLTQAIEPDGRNIVEDYLKRRGWKESAGNRRYMEALRDSCMSLYEVSEIVPGQSFLARDLLRGGEPIRVSEHSATKSLKLWGKIGARIIEVSGKNILAGGLLPFRPSAATLLMEELTAAKQQARREFRKLTREAQLPRSTREDGQIADLLFMATAAPIFSNIWLEMPWPQRLIRACRPFSTAMATRWSSAGFAFPCAQKAQPASSGSACAPFQPSRRRMRASGIGSSGSLPNGNPQASRRAGPSQGEARLCG